MEAPAAALIVAASDAAMNANVRSATVRLLVHDEGVSERTLDLPSSCNQDSVIRKNLRGTVDDACAFQRDGGSRGIVVRKVLPHNVSDELAARLHRVEGQRASHLRVAT